MKAMIRYICCEENFILNNVTHLGIYFKLWSIGLQSDSGRSEGSSENDESNDECDRPLEAPAYKHLIAIHAAKPSGGLKASLKVEPNKVSRLSLNEQAFGKAIAYHRRDVVRYISISISISITQELQSKSIMHEKKNQNFNAFASSACGFG